MAAYIKNKLKAARDAIGNKNWEAALSASTEVLSFESSNYNAKVFKGLALLELGRDNDSEQEFKAAIELNPSQVLAWQGLAKLHERAEHWDGYAECLKQLASMFAKTKEAMKCAESLQKLIGLRRARGSKSEIVSALRLILPTSSFYSLLSTLPEPEPTAPSSTSAYEIQQAIYNSLPVLQEVTSIEEKEEEDFVNREVDRRRMRLGASRGEELKREVGREVWTASKLPKLYEEILNHSNTPDDLRRVTETKLLLHRQRLLFAIPGSGETKDLKSSLRHDVEEMVRGTVLLKIPDILAWNLYFESKDTESIEGYDVTVFRSLLRLFPSHPLSRLLFGYMSYVGISLTDEEDSDEENEHQDLPEGDVVDSIFSAFNDLQESVLAHRIVSTIYSMESEHQDAVKVAEAGLELVDRAELDFGKPFKLTKKSLRVTLAQNLVRLHPPRHHPRALPILQSVLSEDPDNLACLMARGYVLQFAEKWDIAESVYTRVVKLSGVEGTGVELEAREQEAWCQIQRGSKDVGIENLKGVIDELDKAVGKEEEKARAWWRLGKSYLDETPELSYSSFITALKRSPSFAPAFTSLGVYYSEIVDPPDPIRASKCFQKAFELDAREGDAARRLASGFAEEREWDLVEVVARRIIEGEGDTEVEGVEKSRTPQTIEKFVPTHAWAWRAVGAVELSRQDYTSAIQSFQTALRGDQNDFISWLRLGEAYAKSGKHIAAMKTLARAQELAPNDWTCRYLIGDVQKQMSQYEAAIAAFDDILQDRPLETGVLFSLSECHLALGREELATGFLVRAEASFCSAISTAIILIETSPGFRSLAWKTLADTLYELATYTTFSTQGLVQEKLAPMAELLAGDAAFERFTVKDSMPMIELVNRLHDRVDQLTVLWLCILSYDYRLSLSRHNEYAIGSALYDLAIASYTLSLRLTGEQKQKRVHEAAGYIKEALWHDPGNEKFWNVLGILSVENNPKLAQHALIKALECSSKAPDLWSNLGVFYLFQNDIDLAHQAFLRAQTLDPDHSMAWIGQGLIFLRTGQEGKALTLLEHAVGLPENLSTADYEYADRSFQHFLRMDPKASSIVPDLHLPLFILRRYSQRRPEDASVLHLLALILERFRKTDLAVELLEQTLSILEIRYEESEDRETELRYVIANVNIGRLKLMAGDFQRALEAFSTALSLTSAEDSDKRTRVLRSQMHFGSGLANFNLGLLEQALAMFESALEEIPEDFKDVRGHVSVLLAQTLWAMETEEARETAKSQLFECIAADPSNLSAITTLVAMGTLLFDDSLVEAALSEILSMPLDERLRLDPSKDVDHLLVYHHLNKGETSAAISVAEKAIHVEPSNFASRQDLVSLLLQDGQGEAAHQITSLTLDSQDRDRLPTELRMSAVSLIRARREETGKSYDEAQRVAGKAVFLAPWVPENWAALAYARSSRSA